jgi:GH35 family endo-1,4-beta-xylanase
MLFEKKSYNVANLHEAILFYGKVYKMSLGTKRFYVCITVMLAFVGAAFPSGTASDWKDAANARIERLHQREVRVRVVDEQGEPATGISVGIRQVRQAFPFGAAMSRALLRNEEYADFFKAHFNWAVFGNESKWYSNERFQGRDDYRDADAMLSWCEANNIPVRGHCIFWEPGKWQPRWLRDLSGEQLRQAVEHRIESAVTHFRGRFVHWDVDNEMLHGSFFKDGLGESIWPWMFKRAHELDPDVKLFVNEFNILSVDQNFEEVQTDEYIASIRHLLDQGTPIHGVGIQGHIWREDILANPGILKERLDKVAALELPIWISEFDIADDDEASCADKLELVYRTAYSQPAVKGIMMWVFWAGDSWRGPNAGLANRDWTLKEAGKRYEALMKEWSTEVSDVTDADGFLSFRGFHGDYKATVTGTAASFSLEGGQGPQEVTIKLNGGSSAAPVAESSTESPKAPSLGFRTPLQWKSTGVLIAPVSDETHNIVSVKDPTIVRYNNRWHVYATTANTRGGWSMVYLSFADWSDAADAKPYYIDNNPNLRGYHCAPHVFYFRPHKKWYLIYQSQHPQYSTTDDISKPETWTRPENFFNGKPASAPRLWIDYWMICDDTHAYLFFTGDNGRVYRSRTTLDDFPKGMSDPEVVIEGSRNDVFEGSMTYRIKGTGTYLTLVEALSPARYYRAWTSDRLDGDWTLLPDADTWQKPFAGINNVTFDDGVTPWTRDISHGELIRDGYDETLTIDPGNLQFLYQGRDPAINRRYDQLPYRLGLLSLDHDHRVRDTNDFKPASTNTPARDDSAPVAAKLAIRVACGAYKPYTDKDGNLWLPDEVKAPRASLSPLDGMTIERAEQFEVPNVAFPQIFRTERYSMSAYEFNLPNGKYTVRLHFAECFTGITGVGQRVYSFAVQGQKPEKDFDIFKEAGGPYKAIQREYKGVAVTDGKLRITFTPNVENPAINGIEIFAE